MKLSNVIRIWDELHKKYVGALGYCDLEKGISKTVGIENDIDPSIPISHEPRNLDAEPERKSLTPFMGKDILLRMDGGLYCSSITRFSPSGKYVELGGDRDSVQNLGWRSVDEVEVLEQLSYEIRKRENKNEHE